MTWNIQYGLDQGPNTNGWPQRKNALQVVLAKEKPAVLCVQAALSGQLEFLEKILPGHARSGVGRDDGKNHGEHCAIFYDRSRFKRLDEGTFWFSDTPEKPGPCWDDGYNRICSWVRLEEAGQTFRIFNIHFPLKEEAREKSGKRLLEKLQAVSDKEPLIVLGDFNCGPESSTWKRLGEAGFRHDGGTDAAQTATYHLRGLPLVKIDAIFRSQEWQTRGTKLLNEKVDDVYPSDHFGLAETLFLQKKNDPKP